MLLELVPNPAALVPAINEQCQMHCFCINLASTLEQASMLLTMSSVVMLSISCKCINHVTVGSIIPYSPEPNNSRKNGAQDFLIATTLNNPLFHLCNLSLYPRRWDKFGISTYVFSKMWEAYCMRSNKRYLNYYR